MLAVVLPAVATGLVGAEGTVRGVTVTMATAPFPSALTALTRMVTGVPLVKPVTVRGLVVEPVPVHDAPPLVEY